jgi:hypothetical protein
MSGPWAEDGPLHVRTSVQTSLWPLRIWGDSGAAMIECAECDSGELLMAGPVDRLFLLADLTARVEAHIAECPGVRSAPEPEDDRPQAGDFRPVAAAERLSPEEAQRYARLRIGGETPFYIDVTPPTVDEYLPAEVAYNGELER